ncbi:hypothetical protein ACJJTC_008210, partial [Scirpophaga incertulas]
VIWHHPSLSGEKQNDLVGNLSQQQPVGDVVGQHEAADQVLHRAGLAAVRTQHECVQALLPASIQYLRSTAPGRCDSGSRADTTEHAAGRPCNAGRQGRLKISMYSVRRNRTYEQGMSISHVCVWKMSTSGASA